MLVLSRRVNEKVVFPASGVVIRLLGIKRNAIRLGIQAPPEVTVLRGEIPDREVEWGPPAPSAFHEGGASQTRLVRAVDNRLRIAGVGLDLLRGQIAEGNVENALTTVEGLAEDLRLLRGRLDPGAGPTPPGLA